MGLEDRDWYREEQRLKRQKTTQYFKKSSAPKNYFGIILFWAVLLFVLLQLSNHFPGFTLNSPFASTSHEPVTTPMSAVHPNTEVRRQQPQPHQFREVQTDVSEAPVAQSPRQGVVTIYHCKAYSGGTFWSSAYCGTQQALIDRTATVPNGMPFEQQVQVAEGQRVEAMALYNQQPSPAVQRSNGCVALKREREIIESRYTNWQWQPPEVVNPDQTRMRGLRAEQARLGCPTQ